MMEKKGERYSREGVDDIFRWVIHGMTYYLYSYLGGDFLNQRKERIKKSCGLPPAPNQPELFYFTMKRKLLKTTDTGTGSLSKKLNSLQLYLTPMYINAIVISDWELSSSVMRNNKTTIPLWQWYYDEEIAKFSHRKQHYIKVCQQ